MGLFAAIKARLVAESAITDIVGQRIYNLQAPPNTSYPYVVMRLDDREHRDHMRGSTGEARVEADLACVAREAAEDLVTLEAAIYEQLHMRAWSEGTETILSSRKLREQDIADPPQQGQNFGLMTKLLRYSFWHTVPVHSYP